MDFNFIGNKTDHKDLIISECLKILEIFKFFKIGEIVDKINIRNSLLDNRKSFSRINANWDNNTDTIKVNYFEICIDCKRIDKEQLLQAIRHEYAHLIERIIRNVPQGKPHNFFWFQIGLMISKDFIDLDRKYFTPGLLSPRDLKETTCWDSYIYDLHREYNYMRCQTFYNYSHNRVKIGVKMKMIWSKYRKSFLVFYNSLTDNEREFLFLGSDLTRIRGIINGTNQTNITSGNDRSESSRINCSLYSSGSNEEIKNKT
jgi:hypothetical protein